jgi:hypothetical protein
MDASAPAAARKTGRSILLTTVAIVLPVLDRK